MSLSLRKRALKILADQAVHLCKIYNIQKNVLIVAVLADVTKKSVLNMLIYQTYYLKLSPFSSMRDLKRLWTIKSPLFYKDIMILLLYQCMIPSLPLSYTSSQYFPLVFCADINFFNLSSQPQHLEEQYFLFLITVQR